MEKKYVTTLQAAQRKGVTRPTIVRWINQGWIKNTIRINARLWLVDIDEVLAFEPPRRGPKSEGGER